MPNLMHKLQKIIMIHLLPTVCPNLGECHAQKMAGDEGIGSSCFAKTKYTCLTCGNFFCMRCSVFENKEDTLGWKAAKSFAYCEPCLNEKIERESSQTIMTKSQDDKDFSEDDVTLVLS